jgi:putative ABC transport system permease protein
MLSDLKYAFRMLLKAPGFTCIAVITLALGIGANSAIFSVVDTVLLRPLPFPKSEELAMIWSNNLTSEPDGRYPSSFPNFRDYRAQSGSFAAMGAYTGVGAVLKGAGEAKELSGVATDGDFFEALGVKPMLGRGYSAEESNVGVPAVVVLGHSIWQSAFGSNPAVVGTQVLLSGRSYSVLGVMPPGWKFPVGEDRTDYVMPLPPLTPDRLAQRGSSFLKIIARLRPGVSPKQAEAELAPITTRHATQYPDYNLDRGLRVVPLLEDVVGNVRPALLVLLGAVALVLLIACANVANLLLARAAARSREIGIRAALGASRIRIVRQLLAESFVLALLGGAGGLLLAWWGVDVLRALGPQNVPRLSEIQINYTVAAFTFGLAILSTIAFGLVPALQVSRSNVSDALQQGSKGLTGGVHGARMRTILVVSQVSLSLLLLASAGLLIKSFFNLRSTNPGFEPTRLLVLDQVLPRARYPEPDQQRRFFEQLMPKLAALPGIEAVGGANPLPFSGNDSNNSFTIAGQPPIAPGIHPDASILSVLPGYFRAMKTPLRNGRAFDERDSDQATKIAMINEAFARRYLPNENPIGQHILLDIGDNKADSLEIIGVVADAKQTQLAAPVIPEMYQPHAQSPNRRMWLVLRTAQASLAGLDASVRRVVHEMDEEVYVSNLQPMESLIGKVLAQPRFNMLLLAVFAGVAMVLAAIGIYGVIAYSVTQRTREIGIRMALGAQRGDMLRMILGQSLTLVAIGLMIGLIASLAGTRLLSSLLYGVGATDLATYALVVALLGAAALLASYIPARRAMKVDPMIALQAE